MADDHPIPSPIPLLYQGQPHGQDSRSWSKRYGDRHRLVRILDFPVGVRPPRRVRLYFRRDHYVLQWWDKGAKRSLCERVDGDLVAAIGRARQIDERLEHFKTSGQGVRKVEHRHLAELYLADLGRRAEAEEIDPRTVQRYSAALKYYQDFVEQPEVQRRFPHIGSVNREFALTFMAYLTTLQIRPNGHPHGRPRPMRRQDYVLNVVRGMYAWGADPERGKLMPDGFRNPFVHRSRNRRPVSALAFGEPDITMAMAVDFLEACDAYQLRLFAPLAIYGLRAAEPCFLFREHLDEDWLRVPCLPEIAYQTKGRREKRLPLIPDVARLLTPTEQGPAAGLLCVRRGVVAGVEEPPMVGKSLEQLVWEFQRRCTAGGLHTVVGRRQVRDRLLHEAGGITYGHLVAEFTKIAHMLHWPRAATLKDFRHLFATCLENAGTPEHYRKFLMGQSPGRAAIVTYTHLNEVRQRFNDAVQKTLSPLVDAIVRRVHQLELTHGAVPNA